MSAIQMACPVCDELYVTGVVGTTPWPRHVCPVEAERDHYRIALDVIVVLSAGAENLDAVQAIEGVAREALDGKKDGKGNA